MGWRSRTTVSRIQHTVIPKKRIQSQRKTKRVAHNFDKIKQKFIAIRTQSFSLIYTTLLKLKNLLFIVIFLVMLGIFVRWLLDPQTLPISAYILGNQKVATAELQNIITPYLLGGFFYINLSAIQQALLAIPWIKQVSIERIFPDTLSIKIQEYQAVALWNNDMVVDAQGDLFSGIKLTQSLPLFTAPTTVTAKVVLAHYQQLQPILQMKNLQIQQFGCDARRAWFMILENNIHLLLGRDNIRTRLQRFMNGYEHFQSSVFSLCEQQGLQLMSCLQPKNQNIIIHVDLRYTNGMAVRLTKAE